MRCDAMSRLIDDVYHAGLDYNGVVNIYALCRNFGWITWINNVNLGWPLLKIVSNHNHQFQAKVMNEKSNRLDWGKIRLANKLEAMSSFFTAIIRKGTKLFRYVWLWAFMHCACCYSIQLNKQFYAFNRYFNKKKLSF